MSGCRVFSDEEKFRLSLFHCGESRLLPIETTEEENWRGWCEWKLTHMLMTFRVLCFRIYLRDRSYMLIEQVDYLF